MEEGKYVLNYKGKKEKGKDGILEKFMDSYYIWMNTVCLYVLRLIFFWELKSWL